MGFSPSSSHASGGLPASWTNDGHGAVVAQTDGENATALTVKGAGGQTFELFAVRDSSDNEWLYVGAGSGLTFRSRSNAVANVVSVKSNDNTEPLRIVGDGAGGVSSFRLQAQDGDIEVGSGSLRLYGGGGGTLDLGFGARFFDLNSNPAASLLSASQFAIWLDDTPAATTFNIKAKDSGGTVRTASIPLS